MRKKNFIGNNTDISLVKKTATGNKPTTINIHIDKQVEKIEIHSTTIEGSTQKLKEALARVLTEAVNDGQRLAY